jgi:AsmA protein
MRWIIRLGFGLAVLLLLVVGGIALIPADKIAGVAASKFESLTGRKLVLAEGARATFWPIFSVRTGPVTVANAAWSKEGPMLKAEALAIDIDLAALIGGEVKITGIEALRPEIILERGADGAENWVFGGTAGGEVSSDTPGVGRAYSLDKMVIREGSFVFIDAQAGTRMALDAIDAEVTIPEFTGPVGLTGTAVSGGQKVALSAEAGVYSAFTEGRVVPFKAELAAGGSTVAFDGRMGMIPLVAEGALQADLGDPGAIAALAGMSAPSLPAGLGAESLTANGQLTLTEDGAVYLRGATVKADGNSLTGDIDLVPGEVRPKLSAQLRAGDLALAGLSGGQGGGASGGAKADGWPADPIDVSALGGMDLAVALVANSIDLGMAKVGTTRLKLTVDRARAVFDIREMAAYDGQITGEFVVNGRGGLSVGGDLIFAGLAMQPLLKDVGGYDRLIGTGDLTLKFLGVGNSVAAIMQSLKGDGTLKLGKGELRGLDIAGMLRTLDAGYVGDGQKTIFKQLSGSFSITEGVLSNSDLKLVAPYVTATGSGKVGIGARTLDYRLRPTALAAEDGTGGVMVPLLITGTWANPKFRLDLESIAREKMEAEAKAAEARAKAAAKEVEAKAKAKLEKKLKKELGVEAGEGENLEDAAKRRAEEALDAETKRLLEGLLGNP